MVKAAVVATATVMINLSGSRSPGKNSVMVDKVAVRPMTGSWDTDSLKCGKPNWWAKDT